MTTKVHFWTDVCSQYRVTFHYPRTRSVSKRNSYRGLNLFFENLICFFGCRRRSHSIKMRPSFEPQMMPIDNVKVVWVTFWRRQNDVEIYLFQMTLVRKYKRVGMGVQLAEGLPVWPDVGIKSWPNNIFPKSPKKKVVKVHFTEKVASVIQNIIQNR